MNNACLTLQWQTLRLQLNFHLEWCCCISPTRVIWAEAAKEVAQKGGRTSPVVLLSSVPFLLHTFLASIPSLCSPPHPFSSLVNPLEWRNIFFVEQETISRFKGGQSGKPLGTIVTSETKPEPSVVNTTTLCPD